MELRAASLRSLSSQDHSHLSSGDMIFGTPPGEQPGNPLHLIGSSRFQQQRGASPDPVKLTQQQLQHFAQYSGSRQSQGEPTLTSEAMHTSHYAFPQQQQQQQQQVQSAAPYSWVLGIPTLYELHTSAASFWFTEISSLHNCSDRLSTVLTAYVSGSRCSSRSKAHLGSQEQSF